MFCIKVLKFYFSIEMLRYHTFYSMKYTPIGIQAVTLQDLKGKTKKMVNC